MQGATLTIILIIRSNRVTIEHQIHLVAYTNILQHVFAKIYPK